MHALPLHERLHTYFSCCGKTLCGSCDYRHQLKSKEQTCAFCRTAVPRSDEEALACLRKRVEIKDPHAMRNMAKMYSNGEFGLPVDQAKCIELLRESAGFGFPGAQYQLGKYYDDGEMGLERNEEEALKYWGKAAEGGHVKARHNIGCTEGMHGDHVIAMRHLLLAASGGYKKSMVAQIAFFANGLLQHKDLAKSLQAFYRAGAEMKNEERDQYIVHLKMKGEYKEEYDV